MQFSKPLVITDNFFLCTEFISVLKELGITMKFDFAISKYSSLTAFKKISPEIFVLDLKDDNDVQRLLMKYDLVFSVHSKQLFPARMVNGVKCINIHPGYNPINRGWYPQVFAIIQKKPVGATIHEIDEQLDHGRIIARDFVAQYSWDTSATLYNRILQKEIELLKLHLISILNNAYTSFAPEEEGTLALKKDFNSLLQLDTSQQMTLGEAINLLRGLTHEPYSNAYFISPGGEKIFVSLKLSSASE
jgi:dTDP-4-amino-4,6-dideoxyglucose formyltransferase